jgi:hypothetical protein
MVTVYPHIIKYTLTTATSEDTTNEDGDLIPGTSTTVQMEDPCRAEQNVKGQYLTNEQDGQRLDFSWKLFFPISVPEIPTGQEIQVFDGMSLRASGTIQRFIKGQNLVEAWV